MQRLQLRRTCIAIAGLSMLAACTKGEKPKTDSAASAAATPSSTVAATPPNAGAARTVKEMPGALTKPIDSYTGDEFYDLVKKLTYVGGHERERKCKDDPACVGPAGKKTRVLVDAVATEDSVTAATAPQYGAIYVRALNKGDNVEARYGLQPDKKLEYYVIVTADSAGGMKWRLEELDTKSKPRRHASAGAGAFIGCNHPWVAGAQADFKSCKNSAAAHDSVVKLGLVLQTAIDDPIWTECGAGCCIVQ